jgi:hypothetical protein
LSIRLDDLELIKRTADLTDSGLADIRSVIHMKLLDRRSIVELDIPGSDGGLLQDMGAVPVEVYIYGEFVGNNAPAAISSLKSKFESSESVNISSDVSSLEDLGKVRIDQFSIEQVAGSVNRYRYHIVLKEYTSPQ